MTQTFGGLRFTRCFTGRWLAWVQAAESPLKALARQRTLPNFKESTSIRLGEMGRLEEMTEHGEFKHTSRAEAGESMALKTFGRAINVSRKLLIDDDLGLLGDMTAAMPLRRKPKNWRRC